MRSITKKDIVGDIIATTKFSREEAIAGVETFLEIIKESLEKGEHVLLSNFGKFSVIKKEERRGMNFSKGDAVPITQRRVVTFKISKVLRLKLNRL